MREEDPYDMIKEYAPLKSKRFLCNMCLEFLIEITPVIKQGMGERFFRLLREERNRAIIEGRQALRKPPKVKLQCPNGHHLSPYFTFRDIQTPGRFKPTS